MEKKEKTYTAKEIEELLWLPCCHVTGMHDPQHFEKRKYVCHDQMSEAFKRFCKKLKINPKTKSKPNCYWCEEYPDEKKGEGLFLFEKKKL